MHIIFTSIPRTSHNTYYSSMILVYFILIEFTHLRTPFNNLIDAQFILFSSITLPSTNYWMNSLVAVMVFTAVKSVGNLVPLVLVDWMGRKPLMVASHGAMALVTAAYGAGLYVVAHGPVDKPLAWWPVVSVSRWAPGRSRTRCSAKCSRPTSRPRRPRCASCSWPARRSSSTAPTPLSPKYLASTPITSCTLRSISSGRSPPPSSWSRPRGKPFWRLNRR